jgi:transketolase C-terminal domain/subunit
MFTKTSHLKRNALSRNVEMAPTRDGFGLGLVEAGEANEDIVVLCADLT